VVEGTLEYPDAGAPWEYQLLMEVRDEAGSCCLGRPLVSAPCGKGNSVSFPCEWKCSLLPPEPIKKAFFTADRVCQCAFFEPRRCLDPRNFFSAISHR
jgi:hypothetical protein